MGFIPSQTLLSTKPSLCPSSQLWQPQRGRELFPPAQPRAKGSRVAELPEQPSKQFPLMHTSSSSPRSAAHRTCSPLPLSSARVGAAPSLVIVQDLIAVMIINDYLHWDFNEYLHFFAFLPQLGHKGGAPNSFLDLQYNRDLYRRFPVPSKAQEGKSSHTRALWHTDHGAASTGFRTSIHWNQQGYEDPASDNTGADWIQLRLNLNPSDYLSCTLSAFKHTLPRYFSG